MRLFLALGFLISLLAAACSHHHYGYYEPPRDFHHDHWLLCGHYVAWDPSRFPGNKNGVTSG